MKKISILFTIMAFLTAVGASATDYYEGTNEYVLSELTAYSMAQDIFNDWAKEDDPDSSWLVQFTHHKEYSCGNNMILIDSEDVRYRGLTIKDLQKQLGLETSHYFLSVYCYEDQSDGALIVIDRKRNRLYSRSPHHAGEILFK